MKYSFCCLHSVKFSLAFGNRFLYCRNTEQREKKDASPAWYGRRANQLRERTVLRTIKNRWRNCESVGSEREEATSWVRSEDWWVSGVGLVLRRHQEEGGALTAPKKTTEGWLLEWALQHFFYHMRTHTHTQIWKGKKKGCREEPIMVNKDMFL